ncbi:hypothetical protein ABZP36_011198 [Zizania latifolia]
MLWCVQVQKQARGAAVPNARASAAARLNAVQEDLKNAQDHLASIDRDKAQLLHDLALARRLADDAYAKLDDSLAAQRAAEEALELERFKSLEREQSAIDVAQREEDEWRAKCEAIDKRQAEDAAELDRVKEQLALALQAKDSAARIADANAGKVDALTAELDTKAQEAAAAVTKLQNAEASRKEEQSRAAQLLHALKVDIAYAKRAEADANKSAQEWKAMAESLQARLGEASSLNKSNEDSLASLTGILKECKSMLQHEQSQVVELKEKAASLEKEACDYKEGFLQTNRRLDVATKEAHQLHTTIDKLRSELKLLNEAHEQVGVLSQDKTKLQKELDDAREEKDKAKKAVEDLAAALLQVSSEAREAKERVLAKQTELEDARSQISELKAEMKNSQDRYQMMLDESNYEVACLRKAVEKQGSEANDLSKLLAEATERRAGEEEAAKGTEKSRVLLMKLEMDKLMGSLKAAEHESNAAKDDKAQLQTQLRLLESRITEANLTAEEGKISSLRLKEMLADKEDGLLIIARENDGLRAREAAAQAKIDELTSLLAEVTAGKLEGESNGVAIRSPEKQQNMFLKMMCPPMDDHARDDDVNSSYRRVQADEMKHVQVETVKHEKEAASAVEVNTLENSKIIEDDLHKHRDDDTEFSSSDDGIESQSQGDDAAAVDQMNGLLLIHGPTSSFNLKEQHTQKKKQAFLKKFGSLLRKKAHFTKLNDHSLP